VALITERRSRSPHVNVANTPARPTTPEPETVAAHAQTRKSGTALRMLGGRFRSISPRDICSCGRDNAASARFYRDQKYLEKSFDVEDDHAIAANSRQLQQHSCSNSCPHCRVSKPGVLLVALIN